MERSEPSLVPEWLKCSGSLTGSGNSSNQFTSSSSSSHSDNHSALRHARNKLSVDSDGDIGRTSVLDRASSAYFRRSSSSKGASDSWSYSNFGKGHRERDWEKVSNGYHDRKNAVLSDHRNRNYSDSLDNLPPSMFEKDVLRRSQSLKTGKHSDTWPRKATNESSGTGKSHHSSGNGKLSTVAAVGNKSAFERDFPSLGAEVRQVGSEIGRILSPGLTNPVQSLPVGTSPVLGSDGRTSALADIPVGVGNSGRGVAVASQNVPAGSTPTTVTGLNMAEAVAQGPSRARTPPLLNVETQRLEELAIKQSRQLIPLVTVSTPKTLVVSPSEKSRPKVGQQLHPSLSFGSTRGGTSRSDSQKVSNESRLLVLKPSRESNGVSSITTRDNLSPTNGSNKFANSPINITPSAAASVPFRSSGNSPRLATAERNQTPVRMTMEKRATAQAQSRNDFFNLLKKKSTSNSASSVLDSGSAVSPPVSEKSDELGTEDSSTSVTLQDGGVPSSEISIADLPADNRSEVALNGDAYAESQHGSSNGDEHSRPDAYLYPDEEEVAFLRSLGWEENAEDDDGLTEEEISAFFEQYMKLKPSAKVSQLMQSLSPLNSQNGTHGDALSGSSSMDSNGAAWTRQNELKIRPCPVVFSSFSGGPKACMYKVLQMIVGSCEVEVNPDDLQLVKECFSGHIFDSSPVDFTSDLGARFVVHPTVLRMSHPPRIASWIANGIASGLDALFLSRFESHRAEYWQTLYASIRMGAPYLILCSETDDLAPYQIIHNFAQRIQQLGGDVKLVKFNGSPHVGHYRDYPVDYRAAVTELLGKASALYFGRIQQLEGEQVGSAEAHDEISEPISNIGKTALSPNLSFQGTPLMQSDHFLLPSSIEYYEGRDFGSVQDEQKESLIRLPQPSSIDVNGVLGQILFDVCVPKDVEGWDMKSSDSSSRHPYTSSLWRNSHFNPIKCIRRSRL